MYEDLLVTFRERDGEVMATVWRREFPEGRQRRRQVAVYTLDLEGQPVTPGALLLALKDALSGAADYTV
jgi:hypothetical protein